jgi:hypothetical protein
MNDSLQTSNVAIADLAAILADGIAKVDSLTADLRKLSAMARPGQVGSALRIETSAILGLLARLQHAASSIAQRPILSEVERTQIQSQLQSLQIATWNLLSASSQVFPELLA